MAVGSKSLMAMIPVMPPFLGKVPRSMMHTKGFSLMEMAVVLMILGTLLGGVLVAVSQTTENTRRSNALAQLRQIEDALYGYAQTVGELPCPANDAGTPGEEDDDGSGGCNLYYGFVPYSTLGIYGSINSDGLMVDPWQNPYRYAVDDGDIYTDSTELRTRYNAGTAVNTMLHICKTDSATTSCDSGETIAETIPLIVLSMGADWANCPDADAPFETENACEATSTNLNLQIPADEVFVKADYVEDVYDDQLIWLSPYLLFNKMISAGQLP